MAPQKPALDKIAARFASEKGYLSATFKGKGAFKETFLLVDGDNVSKALKLHDPKKSDPARSDREIAALTKCDSPNIGKLYEFGRFVAQDGKSYFYSIEEYLDGGTLKERIDAGNLSIQEVKDYTLTLLGALDHLKSQRLVHRDIKPDNIMFGSEKAGPVLVDFGLVRDLSEDSLTYTFITQGPGTPYYAAPEQLNNNKHLIDWRTDQFSLGVVMGICLTGQHPFAEAKNEFPKVVAAVTQRQHCTPEFQQKVNSAGCGWLIKMLEPWPIHRFSEPSALLKAIKDGDK